MSEPGQPHTIRLRGPWDYRLVEIREPCAIPRAGRMDIGAAPEVLFAKCYGQIEMQRRFSRPTHLDADEYVKLIIGPNAAPLDSVLLNEERLENSGTAQQWECDITRRLQPRNTLVIVLHADAQHRLDQTRLEIGKAGEVPSQVR